MKFRHLSPESVEVIKTVVSTAYTTHEECIVRIKRAVMLLDKNLRRERDLGKSFEKAWVKKRCELSFFFSFYLIAEAAAKKIGDDTAWRSIYKFFQALNDGTAHKHDALVRLGISFGLVMLEKDEIELLVKKNT